jgi:hypothetical protein
MTCLTRSLFHAGLALALGITSQVACAQLALSSVQLVPATPTSADTVYLRLSRPCGASQLATPPYNIKLTPTRIDVDLRYLPGAAPNCTRPDPVPADPILIELGQLPGGSYSVVVTNSNLAGNEAILTPALSGPVNVTILDRRSQLQPLTSRVNYTDHWWDPLDGGAGFMIWHSTYDQLLAVWFSYGPDGKATWYTVQSGTWVTPTRYDGLLIVTSRQPGTLTTGFPEIANTEGLVIGAATLDFGAGDGATTGKLSYHITNNGVDVVRNLRRFGK